MSSIDRLSQKQPQLMGPGASIMLISQLINVTLLSTKTLMGCCFLLYWHTSRLKMVISLISLIDLSSGTASLTPLIRGYKPWSLDPKSKYGLLYICLLHVAALRKAFLLHQSNHRRSYSSWPRSL